MTSPGSDDVTNCDDDVFAAGESGFALLQPLQKIIAHFEQKVAKRAAGKSKLRKRSFEKPYHSASGGEKPATSAVYKQQEIKRRHSSRRARQRNEVIRLSILPEDEIKMTHRSRAWGSSDRGPLSPDAISLSSEPPLREGNQSNLDTSSLHNMGFNSDFDTDSLCSTVTMTSDNYDDVTFHSLQRTGSLQPRHRRHHTLTGGQEPPQFFHEQEFAAGSSLAPSSADCYEDRLPQEGVMSPTEADSKRAAFFNFLQNRYPQHADKIAGKTKTKHQFAFTPLHQRARSRSSYASEYCVTSTPVTSSPSDVTDQGVTYHHSLSRGGRLRSSLPIVRSHSRSRERPLGLIYLEYSGESRPALLPNELTSLDTIRALFVQAYQGLLTMPMLDPQRHSILLKHKKTGSYDQIENVSRIKDRSVIRARPNGLSGIPLPGAKKPPANQKPAPVNRNNNNSSRLQPLNHDEEVAEKNQKNQQKSALKPPAKLGLTRQYQTTPGAKKTPQPAGDKPLSRLPQKLGGAKPPKGKAPSPPPRSAKPTVLESSVKEGHSPNGTLSGNGLGGGSVPQKGFSYIRSGSESTDSPPPGVNPTESGAFPYEEERTLAPAVAPKPGAIGETPMRPKTPVHDPEAKSPQSGVKPPAPRTLAPKPQFLRPTKAEAEDDDTSSVSPFSNIKRSRSPERRATINGAGGSRVGRSFRGQQPKAVSIPQVPAVTSSHDVIKKEAAAAKPPVVAPKPKHVTSLPPPPTPRVASEESEPSQVVTSSADDVSEEKVKAKKGLFGLKRLVSSRSSGKSSQSRTRSKSEERPKSATPPEKPKALSPPVARPAPAPQEPPRPEGGSPLPGRKPALPKTDLLSSLLSNNARQADEAKRRIGADAADSVSIPSDDDAPRVPHLTGVLKHSNLVKSTSASSIQSDSCCSNLSNTPSLKTKKVSFQDDVTVCDANGISTYSNGLRHSDVTFDQSLSLDVSERDDVSQMRAWRHGNRPSTPFDESQHAYSPRPSSHQSAVEAAIQSISACSPVLSTNTPRSGGHFAVTCAPPLPVTSSKPERYEIPHKEEWSPLRRPLAADGGGISCDVTVTQQRLAPLPTMSHKEALANNAPAHDSGPSYFQTGGTPHGEAFNSDTPPYYECCEPATPPAQPITPNELRNALMQGNRQSEGRPPAVTSLPIGGPVGSEGNPPLRGQKPGSDDTTKKRVIAMERQLASLTGMVESIITSTDKHSPTQQRNDVNHTPLDVAGKQPAVAAMTSPSRHDQPMTSSEMKGQLLQLRETAHNLKEQMNELKRFQRNNMEHIQDLLSEKSRDLAQLIASTAGAQQRPLRMRRLKLDQERHNYGANAARTEKQLVDVEAAVEELRNEVVERRCRVNAREVEALVLQLSQAGRTVAQLKGSFPRLCEELYLVSSAESEVIYAEEKFVEAEPTRLDEQLKRCKQLTATLFTLKKLASVQEARSKTPVPFANMRPMTPNPMGLVNDPAANMGKILDDVRHVRVDHSRRMESIRDAEVSWTRRRKFIREYDAKKFEKSLELAEKALNRTDYIAHNDQRRQALLAHLYKHRDVIERPHESNLTNSDSSSLESLPPPPPPIDAAYPKGVAPASTNQSAAPSMLPPPPTSLVLRHNAHPDGYVVISPDGGYTSLGGSPEKQRPHTGSLPRYHDPANRGVNYGGQGGRAYVNYSGIPPGAGVGSGRQTPIHMVERSRSVTPQHWTQRPHTPSQFMADGSAHSSDSDSDRQRYLEQQHAMQVEKSQRLKEQYSKLQMLQRKQRMVEKKHYPQARPRGIPSYQAAPAAKSSDV